MNNSIIGFGGQSDVFEWKDGQVLKLFKKLGTSLPGTDITDAHAAELYSNQVAAALGLPVPAVSDGLIEVDGRNGMIMEHVDGPSMAEYLVAHPDEIYECARQMADLHLQIHQKVVPSSQRVNLDIFLSQKGIPSLLEDRFLISHFINMAKGLPAETKDGVLEILDQLPSGTALCHGDFHPGNVIMGPNGPVVIDWSGGVWGNTLADVARTWFLSRVGWSKARPWSDELRDFWRGYSSRYRKLRPYKDDDLLKWQIVWTAAGIFTNNQSKPNPAFPFHLDFIHTGLKGLNFR
ncbi:MAG: aminoglycoside phosphotransferase family protein [Desulfobacterales bacterium]|nr:aminoglycoside phosphotransferase family protein [Desulfobacterales bacterium]